LTGIKQKYCKYFSQTLKNYIKPPKFQSFETKYISINIEARKLSQLLVKLIWSKWDNTIQWVSTKSLRESTIQISFYIFTLRDMRQIWAKEIPI